MTRERVLTLGRARGQGAGQVRVTAFQLNVKRNDGGDAATDYGAYVTAFTEHMGKTDPSWPNVQPVQELLGQSHPATNAPRPRTYMSVSEYMSLRREVYNDGHGDNRPDRLLEPQRKPRSHRCAGITCIGFPLARHPALPTRRAMIAISLNRAGFSGGSNS